MKRRVKTSTIRYYNHPTIPQPYLWGYMHRLTQPLFDYGQGYDIEAFDIIVDCELDVPYSVALFGEVVYSDDVIRDKYKGGQTYP